MKKLTKKFYKGKVYCSLLACWLLMLLSFSAYAKGISAPQLSSKYFVSPPDKVTPVNPFTDSKQGILLYSPTILKQQQNIDFESRQISFITGDTSLSIVTSEYSFPELSTYIENRRMLAISQGWYDVLSRRKGPDAKERNKPFSLDFAMQVQYPSWARRVLGNEPPKLSIHGFEEISLSYNHDNFENDLTKGDSKGDGAVVFDNKYNISVSGSVGRLINIQLSSSSEEDFAFDQSMKKIKLEYKGEGNELEDEVIQEMTAGYTGFSLPGTGLSGYSESKEGLFGFNVKSKIGPVDLTTVVSLEQGQAQEKTISMGAQTEGSVNGITEKEYVPNKFFFLDTIYKKAFNYMYFPGNPKNTLPAEYPPVATLQLWKLISLKAYNDSTSTAGAAKTYCAFKKPDSAIDSNKIYQFIPESENTYHCFKNSGVIQFYMDLASTDKIAMAFSYGVNRSLKGSLISDMTSKEIIPVDTLLTLREKEAEFDSLSYGFGLMWRNVYDAKSDQDVQVYRFRPGSAEQETTWVIPDTKTEISRALGLIDEDKVRIAGQFFEFTKGEYLVIPPFDSTLNGNEPFRNPMLGIDPKLDNLSIRMYRLNKASSSEFSTGTPRYMMKVQGRASATSSKNTFGIDWGLIQGTVNITGGDGTPMTEGVDYNIDYPSGQVNLISVAAMNQQSFKVKYQSESNFAPDQTVFWGARGVIDLPDFGKKSYIGSSILWQTKSSRDKISRIGSTPFSKLLLDANAHAEFEPDWMTDAVNLLPGIATDVPSSIKLDAEVASSYMYTATSDQAMVEDFESASNPYPLSTAHRSWFMASAPFPIATGDTALLLSRPIAWQQFWFSPVIQDNAFRVIDTTMIAPLNTKTSQPDPYVPVLRYSVIPGKNLQRYKDPWAGIMTPIPEYAMNRSSDRAFEMIIKIDTIVNNPKNRGKLYIDMGAISEEVPWNGKLSDKPEYESVKGKEYDPDFDMGFDKEKDNSKEKYFMPSDDSVQQHWDTLVYDDPLLLNPRDPSNDDYRGYINNTDSLKFFKSANGTQGNGIPFDNEDRNRDGFSTDNHFYRYVIDLDSIKTCKYLVTNTAVKSAYGWYQLSIPVGKGSVSDTLLGKPSWEKIKYVRFAMEDFGTDVTTERDLIFARPQFTGTLWEEQVVRSDTGKAKDSIPHIQASTINTEDDIIYRKSNPDSAGANVQKDQTGNNEKESSLRLKYSNLRAYTKAFVKRTFQDRPYDVSPYKTLSFMIHGDKDHSADSTWFVFRFGADTNTYYEYKTLLRQGWNTLGLWNHPISINLDELANNKLAFLNSHTAADTLDTTWAVGTPSPGGTSDSISIRSKSSIAPSFSSIRLMSLGVLRGNNSTTTIDSGEVWVNEIKVAGLQSLSGSAASASIATQWADLLTLSAQGNYLNGNFRSMTQNDLNAGKSNLSGSLSATIQGQKFFPIPWKVSLPVSASLSLSKERPQLRPGTDIRLTGRDRQADGLLDLLFDKRGESANYASIATSKSIATSLKASPDKPNLITDLTISRLSLDNLSYRNSERRDTLGKSQGAKMYRYTETNDWSAGLSYNLTPHDAPAWTSWRPFQNSTIPWIPASFKEYQLTFLPKSLTFSLASISYTDALNESFLGKETLKLPSRSFTASHGMNLSYSPIEPLITSNYSLTVNRQLSNDVVTIGGFFGETKGWDDFFQDDFFARESDATLQKYFLLNGENTRTQKFDFSFDPRLFDWLDHKLSYSADYTQKYDKLQGFGLTLNNTVTLSGSFSLQTGFNSLSGLVDSVKSLEKALTTISTGLTAINLDNFTLSYSAGANVNNNYLSTDFLKSKDIPFSDFMRFSTGFFSERTAGMFLTGDIDDTKFGGMSYRFDYNRDTLYNLMRSDSRSVSRSWSIGTSMQIPPPLDIKINTLTLDHSIQYGILPFKTPTNKAPNDTTYKFPRFTISGSSAILQKISLFNDNIKNLTLNSSYNLSVDTLIKYRYAEKAYAKTKSITTAHALQPLVQVAGNIVKIPISISYQHGVTFSEVKNITYKDSTTKTQVIYTETADAPFTTSESHTDNAELHYTIEKSADKTELKFLLWSIHLKGRVDSSLRFQRTTQKSTTDNRTKSDGANYDKPTTSVDQTNSTIEGKITYDFATNVNGGISYSNTMQHDVAPIVLERSTQVFALTVRISF